MQNGAFCHPHLVLMKEDAPQRDYPLRELFKALRYFVLCGCQWRMMPRDLPPWQNLYQQAQRWMKAYCFEALAHDLRELSRLAKGRKAQPTAAIIGWAARFKRRSRDHERLASTLIGMHWLAFAALMLSSRKS